MPERTVLVSGASIAGPALAYWLREFGMNPVVVERADALRPGGQTVDVRGAGQTVAQRMGLEDQIRAASTGEAGVAFVDDQNRTKAAFPASAAGGQGFVAELEILRGDLARLLYDHTRAQTEYLFGDRISRLDARAERVDVTFLSGATRDFDLVVAADGIRSRTRALIMAGDPASTGARAVRPLGQYTAYFTIPRASDDGSWARWYNAPGGRVMVVRPDNVGTSRAMLTFMSEPHDYEDLDADDQRALLQETFADAGWEAPRVLAGMADATDFYFELIGQVRLPRWSVGRTALVGDAAYCASPISGMGTSLALVGAYVLAGELSRHEDHRAAFAAYEKVMRPYVDSAQQLPPGTPRLACPQTRAGIALLNAGLRIASSRPVGWVSDKVSRPRTEQFSLPDYGGSTAASAA